MKLFNWFSENQDFSQFENPMTVFAAKSIFFGRPKLAP